MNRFITAPKHESFTKMCEECREFINSLPPKLRENVQEQSAFVLDVLNEAVAVLMTTRDPDAAIILGAYIVGFLTGNTRDATDPDKLGLQFSINEALGNGNRAGMAFRCCKNSCH